MQVQTFNATFVHGHSSNLALMGLAGRPPGPESRCGLCRGAVEKKTVLENLDLVLLAMDEIIDGG